MVDPANGYRYYGGEQVETARLIGLLRRAGMSLNVIGEVVAALAADRGEAAQILNRFLNDLEAQHSSRRQLVSHIHTILRKDNHSMFAIHTRQVEAQRVMSIQRRLFTSETDNFVAEANDNDGPIEAMLGCPDEVRPTEVIGVRTEPAHDEAYTSITKTQWEFPAILAAYDAVACSPEAVARPGSGLSCREVYLAEPDEISDDDLICDVAFPLGSYA